MQEKFIENSKLAIFEKSIGKTRYDIQFDTLALLFCAIVNYAKSVTSSIDLLQEKLTKIGNTTGKHLIDVLVWREKSFKKENNIADILNLISSTLWKSLFQKKPDSVEQGSGDELTYYIFESKPFITKCIPLSTDPLENRPNCAAYIGGIIEGFLNSTNFTCTVKTQWHNENSTVYIIKFNPSAIKNQAHNYM
ncbi:Trafficking protein particle complex subunit 5 [Intoshia linei]|uniref:Trafficking protein particle complex subunit 5 n=1 Tax=Intoshia linei TaxID=1819745 RepID=A0A177B2G8_9BILA|nr:Trafficking protein particle complex subunit 5 [Intoshia linei]